MTERPPSAIGTVAEEAARLIEDMATLARPGSTRSRTSGRSQNPGPYAGRPAQEPVPPDGQQATTPTEDDSVPADAPDTASDGAPHSAPDGAPNSAPNSAGTGSPSAGVCSVCGGAGDGTPIACRLCPICQGIALMRSVRPETVDLLADLALAVAGTLREVATRSRASEPASSARPASGSSPAGDRTTVQDIPVDDDSEG